jgi:hypothetical protein
VTAAHGERTVVPRTGWRTERGAMKLLPGLPEVCFVEAGDLTGAALRRALAAGRLDAGVARADISGTRVAAASRSGRVTAA